MAAKKKLKKIFAVSKICFIFAVPILNKGEGSAGVQDVYDDGNKISERFHAE